MSVEFLSIDLHAVKFAKKQLEHTASRGDISAIRWKRLVLDFDPQGYTHCRIEKTEPKWGASETGCLLLGCLTLGLWGLIVLLTPGKRSFRAIVAGRDGVLEIARTEEFRDSPQPSAEQEALVDGLVRLLVAEGWEIAEMPEGKKWWAYTFRRAAMSQNELPGT